MTTKTLGYMRPQLVRSLLLDGTEAAAVSAAQWCGGDAVGAIVEHPSWPNPALPGDRIVELPGHVFTAMNPALYDLLVGEDFDSQKTPDGSFEVRAPQSNWWRPTPVAA